MARPNGGVIVARTPAGKRTLAKVLADDAAEIAFLTNGSAEPVGCSGRIGGGQVANGAVNQAVRGNRT